MSQAPAVSICSTWERSMRAAAAPSTMPSMAPAPCSSLAPASMVQPPDSVSLTPLGVFSWAMAGAIDIRPPSQGADAPRRAIGAAPSASQPPPALSFQARRCRGATDLAYCKLPSRQRLLSDRRRVGSENKTGTNRRRRTRIRILRKKRVEFWGGGERRGRGIARAVNALLGTARRPRPETTHSG